MSYPSSLPSYSGFTSSETLQTAGHAGQHNSEQTDILGIATKLGTGASTPTNGAALVGNGVGTSAWGQVPLTTGVSGVLPVASGGTGVGSSTGTGNNVLSNSPTLTSPTESGGTYTGATITTPSITYSSNSIPNTAIQNNSITTSQISNSAAITSTQLASTGLNLPPAMYNPYKFSVYCSTNPSLTQNVALKVPLNTKNFDTNTNFDNATNYRFTAPVAGFYWIYAQANIGSAGIATSTSGWIYLYKNGSSIRQSQLIAGTGSASAIPIPNISDIFQLAAGDYIELWAETSDTSRNIGGGSGLTYMSGFLVSAT